MSETTEHGWDREALRKAALAVSTDDRSVEIILAAYFGALEPVAWQVEKRESTGGGTTRWVGFSTSETDAVVRAGLYLCTGRIRGLYPGPIQEPDDE